MTVAAAPAMAGPEARHARRLRNPVFLGLLLAPCLFLGIFYFAPVANVLVMSLTEPSVGLQNYRLLFESGAIHRILGNTLRVSSVTTVTTLLLGYIIAYGLVRVGPRERNALLFIVIASFWISALIRAYAWVAILQPNGLVNQALMGMGLIEQPLRLVRNELGVVIGMVHYMLPYAILPMYANMSGIDGRLMAAARALGASRTKAFCWVFLPLSLPGLVGAGILVMIFSLGFYITPAILGGGRVVMIAEYISIQISETLQWGVATMLATVLVTAVVLMTILMSRFMEVGGTIGAKGKKA